MREPDVFRTQMSPKNTEATSPTVKVWSGYSPESVQKCAGIMQFAFLFRNVLAEAFEGHEERELQARQTLRHADKSNVARF